MSTPDFSAVPGDYQSISLLLRQAEARFAKKLQNVTIVTKS